MHRPRLSGTSRSLLRAAVAVAVATAALGLNTGTAEAADVIENAYDLGTGSHGVVWEDGRSQGCDSGGTPTEDYTLVYPDDIGDPGTDNQPIIVWGNGTDAFNTGNQTCLYREFLEHLAGWGFVIIAPNTGQSGTGDEMLQAVQVMILADNLNDPSNVFYQNLDTSSIAAAGHSQGALGAINATLNSSGTFTSVLAMSTPDRDAMEYYNDPECDGLAAFFCCETLFPGNCIPVPVPARSEMNNLGAPIFFVRGSTDIWSNETADDWFPTATVPYAEASRDGAGHADLTDAIGYMTAWLRYTVVGDVIARNAFVGSPAELETNTNWNNDPPTLENLP